ncbi:MAG: lysozyme inhibitor LprI family protein [Spirulinaceae cyanobacterium]
MNNIQRFYAATILSFSSLLTSCSVFEQTNQINSPHTKASVVAEVSPQGKIEPQIDCSDSSNLNQQEMNICAAADTEVADKKLNQVYQELRSELKGSPREELLINAQQNWIAFRDADCEYEQSLSAGGTIAPLIYSSCLTRITEKRVKDFGSIS